MVEQDYNPFAQFAQTFPNPTIPILLSSSNQPLDVKHRVFSGPLACFLNAFFTMLFGEKTRHTKNIRPQAVQVPRPKTRNHAMVSTFFCSSARQAVPEIQAEQGEALDGDGHSIRFFETVSEVLPLIRPLLAGNSILLSPDYLLAVERARPEQIDLLYAVVFKQGKPLAGLFFQIKPINAASSLQESAKKQNRFWSWVKKKLTFNVLVCGSLVNSGELGLACGPDAPPDLLPRCLKMARAALSKRGQRAGIVLVKDLYAPTREHLGPALQKAGYHELTAQPAMWMELNPAWRTMDDYLNELHSKYRVRAKRAFKKAAAVQRVEFSLEEIEQHKAQLYALYQEVAKGAGFNTFTLHPDYFVALKKQMPDSFRLFAYFVEGELVAFYSALIGEKYMDAHFLGLQQSLNAEHQLYLNMLFDLVKVGIYHRSPKINFARTALEIKSSVGAVPHQLYFYLWHANPVFNALVPRLYRMFSPDEPWQARHPYKEE